MPNLIGSDGTVSELQYAQMHSLGNDTQVIPDGDLRVSLGGGTREITVAVGWVMCCGGLGKFAAATSLTLAANGGTNNRHDYIVAEFNWTENPTPLGTPPNSVQIQAVQGGAGGAVPSLTQTAGTVWQVPLALVVVPTGGGALTVNDARPRRRRVLATNVTPDVTSMAAASTTPKTIAVVDVADPGWPYRIRVSGQVNFTKVSAGFGRVEVDRSDGTVIAASRAPVLNEGVAVIPARTTGAAFTGRERVRLRMLPVLMSGEPLAVSDNTDFSIFSVETIPA